MPIYHIGGFLNMTWHLLVLKFNPFAIVPNRQHIIQYSCVWILMTSSWSKFFYTTSDFLLSGFKFVFIMDGLNGSVKWLNGLRLLLQFPSCIQLFHIEFSSNYIAYHTICVPLIICPIVIRPSWSIQGFLEWWQL